MVGIIVVEFDDSVVQIAGGRLDRACARSSAFGRLVWTQRPASNPHYSVMNIVIGSTSRPAALTLSVDEAAALSGLGRHTVRDAVAAGALPAIRVGRVIRISRIALEQWLADVAEQGVDLADYRAARRICWRSNR